MDTIRLTRAIWALGGLGFVLAELREPFLRPDVVAGHDRATWATGGFKANGVFPTTVQGSLPKNVATVGSWVESDAWQGDAETAWAPAPFGAVRVCVAGYPRFDGCSLHVEFRLVDGSVSRLKCEIPDPGERWMPWDFYIPSYAKPATAFRLVAEDRTGKTTGWLAFSQPFVPTSSIVVAGYESAQVLATLALALTLVWVPGLLGARIARTAEMRTAVVLGSGSLSLAAIGLILWLLSPWLRPAYLGPALVGTYWVLLGAGLWRRNFASALSDVSARSLAISALCICAAVAKSTYSSGPEGELYGGTICRTLAVGNRSDARISFFTSQAIHRHLPPTSAEVEQYYTPWTFFSRGPLAGLVAAPVVFATGGRPPVAAVETLGWEPFDPTGFAAYRITMITLGGLVVFALFAGLTFFAGETWALLGSSLFALCPFVAHEIFFTWPKLAATAWLLASFLFAHQRRPFSSGLVLAVGYLFHPMTLLWAPWLALWAVGRSGVRWRSVVRDGLRFAVGVALLVVPWMAMTRLPTRLPTTNVAGQSFFLRYFVLADWQPATLETWLHTRWLNFSNTFFPLWLHFANESLSDINSAYHPAGPLVKFAFSWWNTLPLGMGLATWAGCMIALVFAARCIRAAVVLLVVAPSLLLTAYWGTAPTGLMRECGHPVLVAVIGVTVFWLAQTPGKLARLAAHRAVPWLQLPEVFLMLWLTTLANPAPPVVDLKSLDPVWFTVNVVALAMVAHIASQARQAAPGQNTPP